MEPPIHVEIFRSGGEITFTFEDGAKQSNSFISLSGVPENDVFPPDNIIFRNSSKRILRTLKDYLF